MYAAIEIESQSHISRWAPGWAAALLVVAVATSAVAQSDPPSNEELQRRIELLAEELDDLKLGEVARELESRHGFGPAASKVYGVQRGLSFGGYGEAVYNNFASERENGDPSGQKDGIDFLRQILYMGYKYDEHIIFNTELEFEHASTGKSGEVSVELAQIDFMLNSAFNARAGLLLVPMGFVNELHEPPIFFGVGRPVVERVLIPSTWRATGLGVFGEPGGAVEGLQYRAYVVESLVSGSGGTKPRFGADGLRDGRQSGSKALAEDFAGVVRADYDRGRIRVGGSVFCGNTSQGANVVVDPDTLDYGAFTTIYEAHVQYRYRGLQVRGLVAGANVGDAELVNAANGYVGNASVGSQLLGWYLEAGWDVLTVLQPGSRFALAPYVRYSEVNTQHDVPLGFSADPENDRRIVTLGLAFYPHSQVVVKGDYVVNQNQADTGVDQWNLGLGYMF